MIVAFDLDDTLYRELDYVESGFRAVAGDIHDEFGIDPDVTLARIHESLARHGRGRQFDDALNEAGLASRARRDRLVQVYRQHTPDLSLPADSAHALDELAAAGHRLFLVTDGNPRVQAAKIDALGIRDRFEHCYITYRYGLAASKPATRVFELMLGRTKASGRDLVYVGDNPTKDFVGVRSLGGRTIRVLTGNHDSLVPSPGYEADVDVPAISDVPAVIASWARS